MLVKLSTYHCILFHPGFNLFHLSRDHPWKNGWVSTLTEQQVVSWEHAKQISVKPTARTASDKQPRVRRYLPELDLTITLILLLTESKFSTWSNSNLMERWHWQRHSYCFVNFLICKDICLWLFFPERCILSTNCPTLNSSDKCTHSFLHFFLHSI